jgi:DNA-binding MurR/RpiR family transcriptional regulator
MKIHENHLIEIFVIAMMQFPPNDFEKLRQFLVLWRSGEIDLKMGKKSLTALIIMIENPDKVATSNIVELAEFTNISPASITRLAKLLGFQGYNYFRQIFKQSSSLKTDFYSKRVQGIVDDGPMTPKEFIRNQLQSTERNIHNSLKDLDNEELAKMIKLLAIKNKIFIFGHQQSSALASIFRYGLSLIRNNVQLMGPIEHGLAAAIGQLRKADLLCMISSSPYSQLTIDIASLAAKQGCNIIAITDSKLSPLHDYASSAVNVSTEGQYYTNSLAANCIVIESILSLTAIELGQSAIDSLKNHEALISKLKVNA